MSDRYPTGTIGKWFPQKLYVHQVLTRDVYGTVLTTSKIETSGKVEISEIELMESGSRVSRNGARIMFADRKSMSVDIGTVIEEKKSGDEWTVVGLEAAPDHQGNTHFWKCTATRKATDKV